MKEAQGIKFLNQCSIEEVELGIKDSEITRETEIKGKYILLSVSKGMRRELNKGILNSMKKKGTGERNSKEPMTFSPE